jgi:cyclic pyranopterin monophosphate synthase
LPWGKMWKKRTENNERVSDLLSNPSDVVHHSSFMYEAMVGNKKGKSALSHLDSAGQAHMVDVTEKELTERRAVAEAFVRLKPQTMLLIATDRLPKGNALETARLAGIMAAKRTPDLIPLCHPILLTDADVEAEPRRNGVRFVSRITCKGATGVEMEALTAVVIAALTLYDMVKAVEKGAVIERICLLEKTGGKSGTYYRKD